MRRPPRSLTKCFPAMKTLLIVHHSMTGGTRQMAQAAAAGAEATASEIQVLLSAR